ncbi:17733_t:CDS:2, partial [Racocetra fulgida]
MTNIHITPEELVTTGTIVLELYYGPYLRDWWLFSKEYQEHIPYPIPIHLELEIMIQLNQISFIIRVVHYVHSYLQPGYICKGGGQSSSVMTNSSVAITSVYQAIFGTKTKIAGPSYLELEQTKTFQKLLEDVIFHPFIIEIENLSIFVSSLGKITCSNKKHLFDLNLKKAISKSSEKWYQIFQNWKQQKSNIIELYTHLRKTYGSNYEFREREVRAWHAIFHATGCLDITPYDKQLSE